MFEFLCTAYDLYFMGRKEILNPSCRSPRLVQLAEPSGICTATDQVLGFLGINQLSPKLNFHCLDNNPNNMPALRDSLFVSVTARALHRSPRVAAFGRFRMSWAPSSAALWGLWRERVFLFALCGHVCYMVALWRGPCSSCRAVITAMCGGMRLQSTEQEQHAAAGR